MLKSIIAAALAVVAIVGTAQASQLSNSWNIGDIFGGYSTSYQPNGGPAGGTWASLSANMGGQDKIDYASVNFYPEYDSGGSGAITGWDVNATFFGRILPLDNGDICGMGQSSEFNARGLNMSQYVGMAVYLPAPEAPLFGEAGGNVSILNYQVSYASDQYFENTWPTMGVVQAAGGESDVTYFQYNVTWYGNFLPGTLSGGFTPPVMGAEVPEPATLTLLALGAIGVIRRRK